MSFNRRVLLSTALLLTVLSINDRPTIRQRKRRLSAIKRLILVWLLSGVVAGCATAPPVVHQPETSPLSGEYQASAFRDRGKAWSAQGDYDRAIADFNKAIEIYPEYAEALLNRGIAYRAKGDNNRAIQDYDQAIRLKPDFDFAFNNRGIAYHAKGDNDRAIQDYDQAIRLKPDHVSAFSNRCRIRAIANETLEAALSDCNESLRLKPDAADALDSRGFVYFRMDRYNSAIADLDKVLSRNPKSADSLYVRGLAKRMRHDIAGSDADIAAAKMIDPQVAERYAGYGVRP